MVVKYPYITMAEWEARDAPIAKLYDDLQTRLKDSANLKEDAYLSAAYSAMIAGLIGTRYGLIGLLVCSVSKYGAEAVGVPTNGKATLNSKAIDILRSFGFTDQDINLGGDNQ